MPQYHLSLPADCPPAGAAAYSGVLYRKIKKPTVSAVDFKSHREKGIQCNGNECQCWGISVWTEIEAVRHAMKIMPWVKIVAEFDVTPTEGVIMKTPATRQPEHHTFWLDTTTDFSTRCQLAKV